MTAINKHFQRFLRVLDFIPFASAISSAIKAIYLKVHTSAKLSQREATPLTNRNISKIRHGSEIGHFG